MKMSDIAIRVENLSKMYHIGEFARYKRLSESLANFILAPFHRLPRFFNRGRPSFKEEPSSEQIIWALKDISFEVKRGEVVGIIGRNGAGKTTLLKVLSRITDPTEGYAEVVGRAGSLLEIGTGFHPELTGRENIFLNGAILGMKRQEIKRKFDEIVAFAELEKFLDTPLKYYSGGMYVRLAFAIAAHLEPEILHIDEVLAVGDASFQKKCLGKMGDVAKEGRTILFVSHSMSAITRLCKRAILLDRGKVIQDGPASEVTKQYLTSDLKTSAERVWNDIHKAPGDHLARLHAVRVHTEDGKVSEAVDIRQAVGISIEYWCLQAGVRLVPNLHFYNEEGINLFVSLNNSDTKWYKRPHPAGLFKSTCWIPGNFLAEGRITLLAAVSTINPTEPHAVERDAVSFQVIDRSQGDGARADLATDFPGVVRPLLKWTTTIESSDVENFTD